MTKTKKRKISIRPKSGLITRPWLQAFVGAGVIFSLLVVYFLLPVGQRADGEVLVRVVAGAGTRTIGRELERQGLVRSAEHFIVWARLLNAEESLQAGEYMFHPGMPPPTIVAILKKGQVHSRGVTIPEGFTLTQIAETLATASLADKEKFLDLVSDPEVLKDLPLQIPIESLEGYLFPDTYRIAPGTSEKGILRIMITRLEQKVLPLLEQHAPPMDMSLHQVLTLASLVEKEAQVPQERALVAGVFLNRLRLGMPLQSDPSVKYVLPSPPVRLSLKDIEIDSPYNTYRYPGLPPGPIASPGLDAISAVLEPAETEYLYFVARGDGTHAFSRTYAEHLEARRQIQNNQNLAREDAHQ